MGSGGPLSSAGSGSFDPSKYVGDGGGNWIQWGKLLGTLAGAAWLVIVGGITAVLNAYVNVHVRTLSWIERVVTGLISGLLGGAGETARLAWSSAFRAAIEASPMLAPVLMGFEIIVVIAILSVLTDRVV